MCAHPLLSPPDLCIHADMHISSYLFSAIPVGRVLSLDDWMGLLPTLNMVAKIKITAVVPTNI
jgi:hypothetical protein